MNKSLKEKVQELRASGKLFKEIESELGIKIPKSSLSYWCKGIRLPQTSLNKISLKIQQGLANARIKSLASRKKSRDGYFKELALKNKSLPGLLENQQIGKMALAMLFLGEGKKVTQGSVVFGNSNPYIVALFLKLLRHCYQVDEGKLRCTVQCRADQNIKDLEKFWVKVTKIPLKQFYKARIDPRTIGKPSKKLDYKGVCRVDYFSANVYNELRVIIDLINNKYQFDFGPIV